MRIYVMLFMILSAGSAYSEAAFMTAGHLLGVCQSYTEGGAYNNTEERICTGYIMGVHDTAKSYERLYDVPPLYCEPPRVTSDQMVLAVKRYLQKNPELLQSPAAPKVVDAFVEEYSCK